jgi:two-component system, response regulator RegA
MTRDDGLPTLLIVDDDPTFGGTLERSMSERGFAVQRAVDFDSALVLARESSFEYALVDVRMPGRPGLELVPALRAIDEGTRIVVFTGYGSIADAVVAMKAGAVDYLTKPVTAEVCERALLGFREGAGGQSAAAVGREHEAIPTLERVEWEYLQRVLADCEGNVSDAARRLGMHRRSLQRKLGKNAPRR